MLLYTLKAIIYVCKRNICALSPRKSLIGSPGYYTWTK